MKKVMGTFLSGVCLVCATFQLSCDGSDDSNANCEDVACTLELRTILVSIENSNQDPVALDSFEVINTADGSELTQSLSPIEFEAAQRFGRYPLASDLDVGANQELNLRFRGFINGQEVIESDYTVASDCCHIGLVSGNLELVL